MTDFEDDDFDISQIIDEEGSASNTKIKIQTPSGGSFEVLNVSEADFYVTVSQRYQTDNRFSNVSDLLELDRILTMELMIYRWSQWLVQQEDYDGRKVNHSEIQKSIENYSKEIRNIKKDLGMDKYTRDKDKGENLAEYISNLGLRAKEFGIRRNEQAVKAITLLMELKAIVTLYENSTEAERKEFGANLEDLVKWINSKFEEFEKIDEHLRKNQKYWIRELN